MSLNNQSAMLSATGRREAALAAIEEALYLVLPVLEQSVHFLPDSGARLMQTYAQRCQETERAPAPEIVERLRSVLVTAGIITGDAEPPST
jgi:hypothetical protein